MISFVNQYIFKVTEYMIKLYLFEAIIKEFCSFLYIHEIIPPNKIIENNRITSRSCSCPFVYDHYSLNQ